MRCLAFVAALPLAVLHAQEIHAQESFETRSFLPADYHNIVQVDMTAVRATGVWDEFRIGLMNVVIGQAEEELGFRLDHLDRFTLVPMAGGEAASGREQTVMIFEGNAELPVPDDVLDDGFRDETIGGHDVRRRQQWRDELFVRPCPKVQVRGSTALLRPMLEGTSGPGMPCADILSLMSESGEGLLAYLVMHLADDRLNKTAMDELFPEVEWPAGERPQFLMARLFVTGDPIDPHVEVGVVLRHAVAGEGLEVTAKAVDDLIQKGIEMPQLRLLTPLLRSVERSRDHGDLRYRLDLGRARAFAGHAVTLLVPMLTVARTEALRAVDRAQRAQAEAAREKKLEERKRNGRGKR